VQEHEKTDTSNSMNKIRSSLQSSIYTARYVCNFALILSGLKPKRPSSKPCEHSELRLEIIPEGYTTGKYVCLECGHTIKDGEQFFREAV
jgi:hypothetical protein